VIEDVTSHQNQLFNTAVCSNPIDDDRPVEAATIHQAEPLEIGIQHSKGTEIHIGFLDEIVSVRRFGHLDQYDYTVAEPAVRFEQLL
jgi:hypothetical protein